jgi:hypothetical protein
LDSKLYQLIWSPLLTNYTHELMTAKQNTDNRHLKFGVDVARSIILSEVFCIYIVACLLSFFFWPLYCMSFYFRIIITLLLALLAFRNTTSQYIQRVYTLQYINQAKTKFSIDVIKRYYIFNFFLGEENSKNILVMIIVLIII